MDLESCDAEACAKRQRKDGGKREED